jgi:hypothetical protein
MRKEIWKNIKGYNGRYQISNLGNVKSFTVNNGGRLMKPGPFDSTHGDLIVDLRIKKEKTNRFAPSNKMGHYVYELVINHFMDADMIGDILIYKDGDRNNVSIDNIGYIDIIWKSFKGLQEGRYEISNYATVRSQLKIKNKEVRLIRNRTGLCAITEFKGEKSYPRIEDMIRESFPDDFEEILQRNKWRLEKWWPPRNDFQYQHMLNKKL